MNVHPHHLLSNTFFKTNKASKQKFSKHKGAMQSTVFILGTDSLEGVKLDFCNLHIMTASKISTDVWRCISFVAYPCNLHTQGSPKVGSQIWRCQAMLRKRGRVSCTGGIIYQAWSTIPRSSAASFKVCKQDQPWGGKKFYYNAKTRFAFWCENCECA